MSDVRIYVVVAATVQPGSAGKPGTVVQPIGRQAAQACHAVSKLRHYMRNTLPSMQATKEGFVDPKFEPITTIILQARDSKELEHVTKLLDRRKILTEVFRDTNEYAYGPVEVPTALACLTTKRKVEGILDYLPLLS